MHLSLELIKEYHKTVLDRNIKLMHEINEVLRFLSQKCPVRNSKQLQAMRDWKSFKLLKKIKKDNTNNDR